MSLGRFLPMFMLMAWAVRADAQRLPEAPPESVGLSSERLEHRTQKIPRRILVSVERCTTRFTSEDPFAQNEALPSPRRTPSTSSTRETSAPPPRCDFL